MSTGTHLAGSRAITRTEYTVYGSGSAVNILRDYPRAVGGAVMLPTRRYQASSRREVQMERYSAYVLWSAEQVTRDAINANDAVRHKISGTEFDAGLDQDGDPALRVYVWESSDLSYEEQCAVTGYIGKALSEYGIGMDQEIKFYSVVYFGPEKDRQ